MIPIIAAVTLSVSCAGISPPLSLPILYALISLIAFGAAKEAVGKSPKKCALYLLLSFSSLVQVFIYLPVSRSEWYGTISALIFLVWQGKTALIKPVRSDIFDPCYYFYGVLPSRGFAGAFNIARPGSLADFGGRVVIGGGWVWCVHKKRFKKIPLSRVSLIDIILVNTREEINKKTNKRLDAKVGTRAVYFFNDCSTIKSKQTLETILIKRMIKR